MLEYFDSLQAEPAGNVPSRAPRRALPTCQDGKHKQDPNGAPENMGVRSFVSLISSRLNRGVCVLLGVGLVLLLSSQSSWSLSRKALDPLRTATRSLARSGERRSAQLLEVFQVYPPVLTTSQDGYLEITDGSETQVLSVHNSNPQSCSEVIARYSFANSYGQPFVGTYEPPSCSFNRVTWNLTVVSAGRQFDRLGIVYLGDIEVFRTSTAEPTADGIEWTYLKDMTSYLALFQETQTVIFDLGNLINNIYTAPFNVTLTASYFTASDSISPADLILPVSALKGSQNAASVFTVPPNTASNSLTIPRNVRKAVFTLAATGQSEEEFWWSNVLQSDVNTYPGTILYGYSPFREVQLYIDGTLAGVAWPFPIVFTGGVVPGLWRPIVGIDAFDLKEDEIDITPFLPLLCDGKPHNFTIRVSGLDDDGSGGAKLSETTDNYWLVTGKIFVWLDKHGHVTTGTSPKIHNGPPSFDVSSSIEKSGNGTNGTLLYHVGAQRTFSVNSVLQLSDGPFTASWQQDLSYTNDGNFTDDANIETNTQRTQGIDVSSSGYVKSYDYPLYAYSVFTSYGDNISIFANVNRGKTVKTLGQPVFPTGLEAFSSDQAILTKYPNFEGAWLSTTQNGTATYIANETSQTSFSFGTTEQDFTLRGIETAAVGRAHWHGFPHLTGSSELFHRYVKAVNGTVVEDDETLVGQTIGHPHHGQRGDGRGFLIANVPGRGGEWHRKNPRPN